VAARLLRALVGEEEIEVEAFAEVAVSLEEAYLVRTDATK
jgi:hypothetical protein